MAPGYRIRGPNETVTFTDITSYFPLYTMDLSMNAEEGSVATSTMTADDPDGAFDYVGHRQFRAYEDTASGSNTIIYAGYTAEREWYRGDFHRVESERLVDITLTDINTVLTRRIIRGSDGNRPAESDVARMQWAEASSEGSLIDDTLYLNTANPVQMDAVDYRDQYLIDVFTDCANASGKDFFLWYRESTDEFSLFYDFSSSSNYRSPLRLSNVLADIDNLWTFAISEDTRLKRDPSRVYSGVKVPFDGGSVYEQDAETSNTFALSGRDVIMPSYNVKSREKATARALRYLSDLNTEDDIITTAVVLPAAKVNFLMQGMAVQFKASHFTDYQAFNWGRIVSRNVTQLSEEYYRVLVDITMTGPSVGDAGDQNNITDGGGGGGGGSNVLGTLQVDIPSSGPDEGGRNSLEQYGDDGTGPGTLYLYDDCSYFFNFTVTHAHDAGPAPGDDLWSNYLHTLVEGGTPDFNMGSVRLGTAISSVTYTRGAVSSTHNLSQARLALSHTAYVKCNGHGSSATCVVSYVSGPDERFP